MSILISLNFQTKQLSLEYILKMNMVICSFNRSRMKKHILCFIYANYSFFHEKIICSIFEEMVTFIISYLLLVYF